jgi:hypothetical protein
VTGFNARKWLIAFLLVTAVMLDSHAAGLKAPVAPGSCVNVGAAKVTVRVLREHGARLNVVAMEPDYVDNAAITRAGGYQKFKESGMAQAIQRVMDKGDSRQLVVALMGNFHSRYDIDHPSSAKLGPSVVEQLARQRPYVVLPLAEATDAWYCQQDGCAVHSYTSDNTPKGRLPQFVVAVETPKGPTVVRLWLSKFTAALPAGKVVAR